jgi:hypothetical protein
MVPGNFIWISRIILSEKLGREARSILTGMMHMINHDPPEFRASGEF